MRYPKFLVVLAVLILSGLLAIQVNAEPKGQGKGKGLKPPAPVPKTGQTIFYAVGDDGDLQTGVAWPDPRFTDNGDGTVTDNLSGLIWTQNANLYFLPANWQEAINYCNDLELADYDDFRLPNIKELMSLLDFEGILTEFDNGVLISRGLLFPEDHPFADVKANYYWSSTTHQDNSDRAWAMSFDSYSSSGVGSPEKNTDRYVWCVRGGN